MAGGSGGADTLTGGAAGVGGGVATGGTPAAGGAEPAGGAGQGGGTGGASSTAGCGKTPLHESGGVQVTLELPAEAGGERGFFLSLPSDYDPTAPHRLIVGYAGTNWVGEQIQPYLGLEDEAPKGDHEIFVYPDPEWVAFEGWGTLGGWRLGPNAEPADGNEDLVFTEAVIDYLSENYCIDNSRIFATGHSWGGDMAQVVSCFSPRFRATAPVAANRPYWFEGGGGPVACPTTTAVWTFHGEDDDYFGDNGAHGDECRDFWLAERGCEGVEAFSDLGIELDGVSEDCVEYRGCSSPVRYCRYDGQFGHQVPSDYFAVEVMKFFRSF